MVNQARLSYREREIMDVIYQLGKASAREVQAGLNDDLANATIRTMLRILEEKGHLTHIEDGRRFIYLPKRPRAQEATHAIKRLVGVFFEGSVASAIAGLLRSRDTRLSDQELDELSELINVTRNEKGAPE